MTIELRMPALSPTMEEGTLSRWLVGEGDEVAAGDPVAEIETDKATMEVEATDDGTLGRIIVEAGSEEVPVGTVIAIMLEEGEGKDDAETAARKLSDSKEKEEPAPPQDAGDKEEKRKEKSKEEDKGEAAPKEEKQGDGEARSDEELERGGGEKDEAGGRIRVSPLARRLAGEKDLALEGIEGSGPRGRIIKRDIAAALEAGGAPAAAAAPADAPAPDTPYEEERLSKMRKIIAARLEEAKRTIPHFYLTLDVEIGKLLKLRKDLNEELEDGKVSVNDFVIRAAALALLKVPDANVQYAGDVMRRFKRADVSVAVATDGGLITPIVRDAGNKSVVEIAREMKDLAERARAGKLAPEEYQGGTTSVSNLGMYGIREFAAVINPPQATILSIGRGEERAVVRHGAVQTAILMTVTLSADHRAVDGAIGAEFLNAFKDYLEAPLTMLI